jgi:adenylyl- and sulfurtransferase ThiI
MEKEITITQFAKELKQRLQEGKTVDCCKEELLRLADMITEKMGAEKIRVTWKD